MAFRVSFSAFCGMRFLPSEFETEAEARDEIARTLRKRRKSGFIVSVLEPGVEWEINEPDDACSVSDLAGILYLEEFESRLEREERLRQEEALEEEFQQALRDERMATLEAEIEKIDQKLDTANDREAALLEQDLARLEAELRELRGW